MVAGVDGSCRYGTDVNCRHIGEGVAAAISSVEVVVVIMCCHICHTGGGGGCDDGGCFHVL